MKLLPVTRIKGGDTLGAIVDNQVSPLTLYAWPVEGKVNSRYMCVSHRLLIPIGGGSTVIKQNRKNIGSLPGIKTKDKRFN